MASILRVRCRDCDHRIERHISDRDAAFAETRAWLVAQSRPCECCESGNIDYWGHSLPHLSRSLLEEWSRDEGLNLGPVEEDVLLGMCGDLGDLIWLLEQPCVLTRKRWDLVAALCHLLLVSLEEQEDEALSQDERRSHTEIVRIIRGVLTKHRALAIEAHNAEDYCLGLDFDWIILPMLGGLPETT